MAPTPRCDSAVSSCFSGCLAFFHRHFPPQPPPSHPLNPSLYSQQQPSPQDCSKVPQLQLPATEPSRGPAFLSRVWCSKDCLNLIPFSLLQISCFTLSLKCLSSDSDNCPDVGIGPLLQFPHPLRSYECSLFPPQFLPPIEFCMVLYILFRWLGTPACSQLVFCVHCCV